MSDNQEKNNDEGRVFLVVPARHVKTVKSALEQFELLDRTSRIMPETQEQEQVKPLQQDEQNQNTRVSDLQRTSAVTSAQGEQAKTPGSNMQFPALRFNEGSGEYVEQSDTQRFPALGFDVVSGEYKNLSGLKRGPAMQFDAVSGEYKDPSELREFPHLGFDTNVGEYKDPSEIQKFPHLEFDTLAGEYRSPSGLPTFPHLEFDVVAGQYKSPSESQRLPLEFDPDAGEYKDSSKPRAEDEYHNPRMHIPTIIPFTLIGKKEDDSTRKSRVLEQLGLGHLSDLIEVSHRAISKNDIIPGHVKKPLHKALRTAPEAIQDTLLTLGLTSEHLLDHFPEAYSIYKPMLLLPHNAITSEPWRVLLSSHSASSDVLQPLWRSLAGAVGTTHVAVNSPIPLQAANTSTTAAIEENILRSPVNLTPIYGDFGPKPTPQALSSPTESDFNATLWVTATQNGIHQTWAPLYTMFSRGNIREKTRILNLPSVARDFDVAAAVGDLYAGIGYFAFSYKKAGISRTHGIETVLCWEINPWSVEGLRRGAEMNGWTCRVVRQEELPETETRWKEWRRELGSKDQKARADFWVFQMSNEVAGDIVEKLGTAIPPIRHVNLGLLPSSSGSWPTAVKILDASQDGWIHVHENVAVKDIDTRAKVVELTFERLLNELEGERAGRGAVLEHVERVKMYAPGVAHCVFDVRSQHQE